MRLAVLITLVLAVASPLPTLAIDADEPLGDPAQQVLYERLTNEVRCLVCQNQTIADSTAALAGDLRREIRDMVEAGRTEAEIKSFLTDRYGDFVLYRPRYSGPTALLWLAPLLLFLGGGAVLWRILRRRAALPVTTEDQDALDRPGGGH